MIVAPTGTIAWRRLLSGMRRPRDANMRRITSATPSSTTSSTPITSAIASRVMSSWVGPEAAAHDHGVGPRQRGAQPVDDAGVVVAHLGLEEAVDAAGGELLADPGRVGVDDLAEQQLGADGDDVAAQGHGVAMMPGAGPRPPVRRAASEVLRPGDDGEHDGHPEERVVQPRHVRR